MEWAAASFALVVVSAAGCDVCCMGWVAFFAMIDAAAGLESAVVLVLAM